MDLLLKEMGTLAFNDPANIIDPLLDAPSPTKPLSVQNHKNQKNDRDCNSSSDTYVSDHDALAHTHLTSFEHNLETPDEAANFWMNDSQLGPENHRIEDGMDKFEDFDAKSRHTVLPSKSIMKSTGTPSTSPKKSVAFPEQSNLETLHHYTPTTDHENSPTLEVLSSLIHMWSEMDKNDQVTESTNASPPPVPPPHTSNTITGLLSPQNDEDEAENDDVDISVLSEYRLSHKNYSNLSLNEKLDIFLNNSSHAAQDDLDDHLEKLNLAKKEETDVNIHHLSFQLDDQREKLENPLNVLHKTQEVRLRSAGSSQSSLQSLMDSNRQLNYNSIAALSSGIQLNDGIKGFSDAVAGLIIPSTDIPDLQRDSSPEILTFDVKRSSMIESNSEEEVFQDSFDHSYNLTEKSIMNLLNSASQVNLPIATTNVNAVEKIPSTQVHLENSLERKIKQEPNTSHVRSDSQSTHNAKPLATGILEPSNTNVKAEPREIVVKSEPEEPLVKQESDSENERAAKEEPTEGNVKEEPQETLKDVQHLPIIKTEDISREVNDSLSFTVKVEVPLNRSFDKSTTIDNSEDIENNENPENNAVHENKGTRISESTNYSEHPNSEDPALHDLLLQVPVRHHAFEANSSADLEVSEAASIAQADVAYRSSRQVRLVASNLPSPKDAGPAAISDEIESSNDGDIDEDTDNISHVKLETIHHSNAAMPSNEKLSHNSSASDLFEDTSEELLGKTLAPLKIDHGSTPNLVVLSTPDLDMDGSFKVQKETSTNAKNERSLEDRSDVKVNDKLMVKQEDHDNSVLANSSNILPPLHLMPPPSASVARFLDPTSTFEESLSAEHDKDKKNIDYLSIWHLQLQKRKHQLPRAPLSYQVPNLQNYNTSDLSNGNTYHIPASLKLKKFKEVNLVSKRVVSPGFEDLQVSGFLPEISQTSGLEGHFKSLMHSQTIQSDLSTSVASHKVERRRSLGMQNVLSQIDDPSVEEPPAPGPIPKKSHSIHNTLRPVSVTMQEAPKPQTTVKKSKFHVPTFEIKRSNSKLSPKNFYNDIFEDIARPTIKASGMKTLPSMDREDVKRILQMKQAMSHEEYANLKLVGTRKRSVIQEPEDNYDKFQQLASVHCESLTSSSDPNKRRSQLSHVMGELQSVPVAIESKDQILNDLSIFQLKSDSIFESPKSAEEISTPVRIIPVKKQDQLTFPDPDPELISNAGFSPQQDRNTINDELHSREIPQKPSNVVTSTDSGPMKAATQSPFKDEVITEASIEDSDSQTALVQPVEPATQDHQVQNHQRRLLGPVLANVLSPLPPIHGMRGPLRPPANAPIHAPLEDPIQHVIQKSEPVAMEEIKTPTETDLRSQRNINGTVPMKPSAKIHVVKASNTPPQKNTPKSSPIKINSSPVRLVKNGDEVTGVVLDKPPKMRQTFVGEIANEKIREQVSRHEHALSTVSVPSNVTDDTLLRSEQNSQHRIISDSQGSTVPLSIETDRGKLFLRVVGLKNIALPDVKSRKGSFSITLDNGVHCIKTPNYNLDSLDVLIGKEFELTVGRSLEFILTMKAIYDKPKGTLVEVHEKKVVKSRNRISRLFGSKEIITTTKYVPQEVKDPWQNKFAGDGSFARCYVDLEQYELQITGIARNFNISCFNEWETATIGGKVTQRNPYKIAQLEVKMLFVPKSEPYEILPTSIKSAYESLDELRTESHLIVEGYMHQDGGDCETWKKRWFKLSGTSLIAHSEFSHKTRAKINLAKVVEVIYVDKENVNRSSSNYRNFSDILLVQNAFKIRFANGEIIDFGAANKEEKLRWIRAIQEIVYRNKFRRQPWIQLMQEKNGNSRPRSIVIGN